MRNIAIGVTVVTVAVGAIACDNDSSQNSGSPGVSPTASNGTSAVPADAGPYRSNAVDAGPADGDAGARPSAAPGAACVWSADCAAGQHCDLGECFSECTVPSDCSGSTVCSPRGRCLAPGVADEDPPPVTKKIGTLTGEAVPTVLSESDQELTIRLRTDTTEPVRYRVSLDAPYLSLDSTRGEFSGDTSLTLRVDASALTGKSLQGAVRVYTTLGSVVVNVPMRVGVTGVYRGVLAYHAAGGDGGHALSLGRSELVVDLVGDEQGDLLSRVEPERSLLFPEIDGDAMRGRGTFAGSSGVDLTMRQAVPEGFGGDSNPFGRPVGRQLHFRLKPGARGSLDGTFEETVFGLYTTPVVLSGDAHFDRDPAAALPKTIDPPADPVMPTVALNARRDVAEVFPGWTSDCLSGCEVDQTLDCAALIDLSYHAPLELALSGSLPKKTDPLGDIAETCRRELSATAATDAGQCASPGALACALGGIESRRLGTDADGMFGLLYTHTIDPALFVAQDDVVTALRDSFVHGFAAEAQGLEGGRSALIQALRWVLSAPIVERLRRSSPAVPPSGGESLSFSAARTLVRALYVLSTIDAELARLSAGDRTHDRAELLSAAQEKAVIALFEASVVGGLLDAWQDAPPDLGAEFSDVLTSLSKGFATLVQGPLTFGVPEGFIPMVFEPGRKPTNFEQEMDLIQPALDQASADESAFIAAKREFELSSDGLDKELENVRAGYDEQIRRICGSDFDLDKGDLSTCGAGKQGDVGASSVEIDEAQARVLASEQRMSGMRDRIDVEWNRLTDVQAVREGTIQFTKATGERLSAITYAEGILNTAQKVAEMASQAGPAQPFNGIGAAAVGIIEMAKTGLDVERQEVQTAQDVRIQADNAKVEVINGMAVIKGLMIDMAQLRVEMRLDLLGVLEAEVDMQNSFSTAGRLLAERARAIARIGKNARRDASYRLLEERAAVRAVRSRADAQRALFLAGRALAYELDDPFEADLGAATLNVFSAEEASSLKNCLGAIYASGRTAVGASNAYSVDLSLRKILGVDGPVQDAVTGETLSEGEQFRRFLLRNENIDGTGGVSVEFSSNLGPENGLWPTTVCDDRIASVEAELVGDFIGDNQAEVDLTLDGGGLIHDCDSAELIGWSTSGNAVIQAGVNSFGTAPSPNESLHGLSVATSKWKIVIPGPTAAPSNADLDLMKLEDITLRVRHAARPPRTAKLPLSTDCLANIGAGR